MNPFAEDMTPGNYLLRVRIGASSHTLAIPYVKGPGSGAALATVVGVLVEVPVMLSVCRFCVATRGWFTGAFSAPTAAPAPITPPPTAAIVLLLSQDAFPKPRPH